MLTNSDRVTSHFGCWPQFCDAKIESFSYLLPGTIKISLRYIDAIQNMRATIDLPFSGVTNMDLDERKTENVVDEIAIREGPEIAVSINAAYGLFGSFLCSISEVVHVTYA